MIKAAAALLLAALAPASAAARGHGGDARTEAVPFVGCASDGQVGPLRAPPSGQTPRLPVAQARRLAFYRATGVGVLAPRGWSCAGVYGSNGESVIVTPERHRPRDFVGGELRLRGPAVELSYDYGGTSGRFAVVSAIGRYFPHQMAFARRAIADELGPDPMPAGPYPADRVERRSENEIRFTTPAGREGEGTSFRFDPAGGAVRGLALLIPGEELDLVTVRVRLPAANEALVQTVIDEAARRYQDPASD